MKPDVLQMMKEQSDAVGLNMSAYLERLILEKHYMAIAKSNSEDSINLK